jgi:hypothetical protein
MTLLDYVRQLVRDQTVSLRVGGAVSSGSETDVLSDGERVRGQRGGELAGADVGVDTDTAEVVAKSVLQVCAKRGLER